MWIDCQTSLEEQKCEDIAFVRLVPTRVQNQSFENSREWLRARIGPFILANQIGELDRFYQMFSLKKKISGYEINNF